MPADLAFFISPRLYDNTLCFVFNNSKALRVTEKFTTFNIDAWRAAYATYRVFNIIQERHLGFNVLRGPFGQYPDGWLEFRIGSAEPD